MREKQAASIEETKIYIQSRIVKDPETDCWIWSQLKDKKGYGLVDRDTRIFRLAKTTHIHRVSYLAFKGKLEEGMVIRHRCNNHSCCNPVHLEQGTQLQNMADKYEALGQRSDAALVVLKRQLQESLEAVEQELSRRKKSPGA
jgi:hypothetical protein